MGATRARLSSLSLSLPLLAVVSLAVGCGDNTPSSQTGTGGAGVTGTGGSGGGTGGTSTGGAGGQSTGGVGGIGTGGSGGIGTGGAGGVGTGGSGGIGTGGSGGIGTGGSGGVGTGGSGGVGTGGAGGAPAPGCYTTAFTAPTNGATLTVTDDSDHTCGDGFQYTVTISSAAPDGTDVTLYDGSTLLKTVKVSGGAASFAVQLSTAGAQQLSIQYPSTQTCNVTENVTVTCPNNPPTCTISQPVISATHPELNGVPTAQGGDRSSSVGSAYQATFVVNTNAEDGQAVTLAVNSDATNPPTPVDGTPTANVSGGSASFGLTLVPDGTYDVTATCVNKNGITGTSTKSTFTVDTTPPDLTVTSPSAGMFVVGGTVRACAQTDSSDAASLAGSLGAGQQNLCVTLGSSATPSCVAVAAVNSPTCVNFLCPGSSAFSLTYQLKDAAGNPTTQTVTGVTCASALPSVEIVAPVSDAPLFQDKSKHILAANAPIGVKDEDPNTIGAQADVVACTDTVGTATLFVGHQGDTSLVQLGTAMTTTAATGQCPASFGNVAVFAGVTLPESNEKADGSLLAATELQVSVTSAANAADTGTSLVDDVWVDSQPPNLALLSPNGLCGSFAQNAGTLTEDISYTADDILVELDVTNNGTTTTYDVPAYVNGVATFGSVALPQGQNTLAATEGDPAGNATALASCTVTVGMAPVVTFTTPTAGALLCPNGSTATGCIDDNDTATAGWQGTLTVNVKAGGTNVVGSVVTFTDGTTTFGMATTDANGNATFSPATVAEGSQTIVATTDNVPGAGIGSGSVNVTVDTAAPAAPGAPLLATVTDRRKTSMQLTWTAPSDGNGGDVASYLVRYSKTPIVTAADFAAATDVPYGGQPAHFGQLDGIGVSGLYIETNYYFAVEGVNAVGTVGPMLATSATGTCDCMLGRCCAAHFNVTTVTGTTGLSNEQFGFELDGSGDVSGDGVSDLVVGSTKGQQAYLFLGGSSFTGASPSVVFSGTASTTSFGSGVAIIGDIDHDGLEDVAISDPGTAQIFVFKGRRAWPSTINASSAEYKISGDSSYAGSSLGSSMTRLGDFNGDGVDDFAAGAPGFTIGGAFFVGRVVVVLGKSGFGAVSLPDMTNAITIDGDTSLSFPFFGDRVLGIGRFYTATAGTTLVVSAPGFTGFNSSKGEVYAFHGQSGTSGAIALAAADNVLVGPAASTDIGAVLCNLGPMVSSSPSIGIGNPADTATAPNGSLNVVDAAGTTNPFSRVITLVDPTAVTDFGQILAGGGVPGRNTDYSLLGGDHAAGTARPDLLTSSLSTSSLTIVDGNVIAGLGTAVTNVASVSPIQVALPSGWGSTGQAESSLIPDINADGYPDFAVANAINPVPGEVAVYW